MKKAIIIGATSGIGNELARLLLKKNYFIGITGRRLNELKKLKGKNPNQVMINSFDCTLDNNSQRLTDLVNEMGGLDLLILSAGTGDLNESLDFTIENNINLLNVNAFTEIVNWAYKYFYNQGHGHLLVISSIAGLRGGRMAPAYNASKAYQINYLEGLRQKAHKNKKSIIITDVRPGFVDTAMAKGEGLFWVSSKEKAAKQIYQIILKKKAIGYVTKRWWVIAKLLKLIPSGLYKRM
ncbi:SDR family NAD(P)-dependent oxidoreductase [Yeosuana marina]|uniref:SDR family NAD(P)-dependent oxidoreductase n=1 Tax=Yeosuana marina TaxID=1565536 RepID=UPI00142438BA|nr:SDR family NAD(P)-dependent oxidoreductase [Yeosuana marina]